jgi:integrase/recombinase XerD
MAKVGILKRVKLEGGWQFCPIVRGGNGKIKPDAVMVKGREEIHLEGLYYVDFLLDGKRKRISAESSADAVVMAEAKRQELVARKHAVNAGIELPEPETKGGRSLTDAVTSYLLEIAAHKKRKTHSAYRTALTYFLESCHKSTLESITRTDLLAFKTYLRDKKKQSDRSVANKFISVTTFLKQQKIVVTNLISKNDRPVFTEEEVSVFTDEDLKTFFAACDETQSLWFKFFYITAMREQEIIHAEWSWIDWDNKTITVRENRRFGFKPKAYKGRSIPLTSELVALLKAWKDKSDSTCGLIFPTSGCRPKFDFLDVCKAIAKRVGLTDFYLHKFRATRATHLLQDGMDITSVQRILGHSDLASTQRYLGAQRTEVLQAQVEQMASRF